MKILAIETSCDETAVSIVSAKGGFERPVFEVLAEAVHSQVDLHTLYGGVVPMLAKREHAKRLVPLLKRALEMSKFKVQTCPTARRGSKKENGANKLEKEIREEIKEILEREPELAEKLLAFLDANEVSDIDVIAVTEGPGLEPALWVGINAAKALALAWGKPLVPINHLEGHLLSVLITDRKFKLRSPKSKKIEFPVLGLIVSGGHTELVLMRDWLDYEIIGQTRDDAAGEAFDKVARILDLPYPGGPEISKLAKNHLDIECPGQNGPLGHSMSKCKWGLPRPMINSKDFDFSFSGLKTAVLYLVKKLGGAEELDQTTKAAIAAEFQQAVIDVLVHKTLKAAEKHGPKTFIAAGGVMANKSLKQALGQALEGQNSSIKVLFPDVTLATDNATMIAAAGYFRALNSEEPRCNIGASLVAKGNLRLGQ
ncbi:MAG: tRNA (adenosine(37)-N6)-threonylcarbamoyltransferase complex transferase subunit TsaD [Patescibacteria group bacterium]|nr:tRNA (adenosine(37)-N6)-threonylcarbamoyltransferase complex transferase subunit TsaD [Patescibacteria group bacterium]